MAFATTRLLRSLKTFKPKLLKAKPVVRTSWRAYSTRNMAVNQWTSQGGMVKSPQVGNWFPWAATPFVAAAFWFSSGNDNTLEKAHEDIEKLILVSKSVNQESADLSFLVTQKIANLPNSEVRRDTAYILSALDLAAKIICEFEPISLRSVAVIEQCYALAKRVKNDKQQPDDIRLTALRTAHRCEYCLYLNRQDMQGMKKVLIRDLSVLNEYKKDSAMNLDESQSMWTLAAVLGSLGDQECKLYLEESLDVFRGITTDTLTPELEKYWIERLVATLSHALALELGDHKDTAIHFRRVALALYEQYRRLSTDPTKTPEWKELESRLKASAIAAGNSIRVL